MFYTIPQTRPSTPLLDKISSPADLRELTAAQLPDLAYQLRAFLLYSVGQTGGHFGAGLGVTELTIALHYLLETPEDHLIWDVGHQSYPHKILTGRREALLSIRQKGGLAPFPRISESPYDDFGTGHSSTSVSAALGMALADRLQGLSRKTVAVIGDGAMTAGMAFEGLNHAAHTGADLLVILNDNDMSISHNEGGLATYLAKNLKDKMGATTAALFEALDFHYSGPVDGNNFEQLLPALKQALAGTGPQFLHITTVKGKGYAPAEKDPIGYHAITKIEPIGQPKVTKKQPTFASVFGQWICQQADQDLRTVAITPAMSEGSGLVEFSRTYIERYFDVAIAEQHAITLAAGMAYRGLKPVVAIYSTFLQRGYDQLIHDVAIQELDILFAIDRAGLVGEDGATHAGCYDISYLRCIPDMVIMTPSDEQELSNLLQTGYEYSGPAAVRYPRGSGRGNIANSISALPLGKATLLRQGNKAAILNFGPLLPQATIAAEQLDLTLVDMRFVKPLDQEMIDQLVSDHPLLITLEDHSVKGGAGSEVSEYLHTKNYNNKLLTLGIPDRWIEHASREQQLQECGLDSSGIIAAVSDIL
ncbi:1-deoxy-D-xylulose-5-phosphate synthase [Amphritea balenae]|uniref:1-deoxy-D-xylulose-5-phosphate synthase n=1 Tax=Amphritea balenae TaxID=452629 RepID=A0A3P1SIZ4_9GAMM|nr:1-deoxy-D-xylulose-5-phosphate synthase [Amphritea balenae]RRC97271.1 1-deoxy-D-xylulose-5-phosphate synthase [Amphritea balenae]GGK64681.1 1-deoxy-D-xylulose-5-phosphate synthase [Amphritea balenae]